MMELLRRTLGVNFASGGAQVYVWAPLADQVTLHNETSGSDIPLQKKFPGYWTAQAKHLQPGDNYRFSLNGGPRMPDPASLSQPDGVYGASQALDLHSFTWTDTGWHNLPLADYIIYELHPGTFSPEGSFSGIARRLDYLKDLGVNAIELMPVAQFPGRRNWGYDGVFPYAVQNSYGGAEGLLQLVNACHSKGIAVIADVVYNHLGPEGNCLPRYGPYFTDKYKSYWGDAVNFDDAYCDGVRRFFLENALMWLRDFHIDALRLDAVHAINDQGPRHIMQEMSHIVSRLSAVLKQEKYLIAETDLNDSRYIRNPEACGYGIHAQWCDDFHHALLVAAGQARQGYYADFNGLDDLARSLKEAYVFTGQYSGFRHKPYGTPTTGLSGDRFIVFSQNHDQVGNRMMGERTSHLFSFRKQQLMAASVLLSPFIPLLFMGEEWRATTPFPYFIDHSDPALQKRVAEGRKAEFAAFHREGSPPEAHAPETFERAKLLWEEQSQGAHAVMLNYYKQLITLRKTHPALKNHDRASVSAFAQRDKGVLIVIRSYKEQRVYCIFNFSEQLHYVQLAADVFPLKLLLATHLENPENEKQKPLYHDSSRLALQPESAILLTNVLS